MCPRRCFYDIDGQTYSGSGRRLGDSGAAVKPFSYWRDPACWLGGLLYAVSRWTLKPHVDSVFLISHFNDLLLIPCALPIFLFIQRKLRWRLHDEPPTAGEILGHLLVWSVLFEVVGPHIMRTVGDVRDVLAYCAGAAVAALWWHRTRWGRTRA